MLEQDNNPTIESAEHSPASWRSMLDTLKKVAERADAPVGTNDAGHEGTSAGRGALRALVAQGD